MSNRFLILLFAAVSYVIPNFQSLLAYGENNTIVSKVDSTSSGELILIQELVVKASLEEAWQAYTTEKGWKSWVAPLVEIDFKTNGIIRTNYNNSGSLGDAETNVLRIVNYVPNHFITLQADISKNWPEFMKKDHKVLFLWFGH